MVPNTIQILNDKQEANNKEFKAKTYKKASLSTSLTNLYVSKSNFAIKIRIDLSKVTSKNTRAAWVALLGCITNDMNKSFPVVIVKRAKQNACKDLYKVVSQKSKAMDRNALSYNLTNWNRPVSKTNKKCQTI